MSNPFAPPLKHPRHIIGDRPSMTQDRVVKLRVTDYVTTRMKERSLQVPLSEMALSSPTVSSLAVTSVIAPFAVPAMITACVHTLNGMDYDRPQGMEYAVTSSLF